MIASHTKPFKICSGSFSLELTQNYRDLYGAVSNFHPLYFSWEKHMEKSLGQSTSINYKSEFIRNRPHTKEGFALKANFISPVVPYGHGLDPALQENIAD